MDVNELGMPWLSMMSTGMHAQTHAVVGQNRAGQVGQGKEEGAI